MMKYLIQKCRIYYKLKTIRYNSKSFLNKEIRSIGDKDKEDYYHSVVDVIGALTESESVKKY